MYSVELTRKAKSFLKKLSKEDQTAILTKLYSLRENPIPHLRKLKGTKLWRLRIGKYRSILDILIKGRRIIVLKIGRRDGLYK